MSKFIPWNPVTPNEKLRALLRDVDKTKEAMRDAAVELADWWIESDDVLIPPKIARRYEAAKAAYKAALKAAEEAQ